VRASAAAAWPAFCTSYEGRCTWLYLDTLRLPTTGLGHRVFTIADMVALPWQKGDRPATDAEKRTEWTRIGNRTDLAPKGGYAYRSVATLHLTDATVDDLLTKDTPAYWDPLVKVLPDLEQWPADAQLAIIDMSYNLGAYFLGSKWPNFTKAAKAGDFTGCAVSCLRAVKAPRDYRHQRLFTNAATVAMLGADPDTLWDTRTPSLPDKPTDPEPEEPDVAKVKFRGGWTCSCVAKSLPLVEKDMIRRGLIKYNIDIYQLGYRNDVGASAGTHAGGGNTDVGQFSDAQIDVWRLWGWTIQHRTRAQGFDMDHGHGWPLGCTHLSSGGRSQASQWANRQNGLVSRGRVAGRWPIDTWKTAMKKRLAEIAEAEREKELELPTTGEVTTAVLKAMKSDKELIALIGEAAASADVVPNEFTSNTANEFVAMKTALVYLSRQNKAVNAKLDALVAATFPVPTEPPAGPVTPNVA
jgi:GH24 family phage-related lysozyme (muramidase)